MTRLSKQVRRVTHYAPMERTESYCSRTIPGYAGTPRTDTVTCKDCRKAMAEKVATPEQRHYRQLWNKGQRLSGGGWR